MAEIVTKAECEAMIEMSASCGDCRDGILFRDSLAFDLDREDEDQKCPGLHNDVPRLARAYMEAKIDIGNLLTQIRAQESCTGEYLEVDDNAVVLDIEQRLRAYHGEACPLCKGTGSIPNGTDEMACGRCAGTGNKP